MMRRIIAGACLLLLSACISIQPVDPATPAVIGDITVDSQVAWANIHMPGQTGTTWTVDGFGLNELRFYTGIEADRPLFPIPGIALQDLPHYDATMLPNDVMELVASALARAGYQQVQTAALTPAPFGSSMGFRFSLTCTTPDGLQMKGQVLAAQRNGKLDVILFIAASEHYYDRLAPVVDRIFASVKTV